MDRSARQRTARPQLVGIGGPPRLGLARPGPGQVHHRLNCPLTRHKRNLSGPTLYANFALRRMKPMPKVPARQGKAAPLLARGTNGPGHFAYFIEPCPGAPLVEDIVHDSNPLARLLSYYAAQFVWCSP